MVDKEGDVRQCMCIYIYFFQSLFCMFEGGKRFMRLRMKAVLSYCSRKVSPITGPRCPDGSRKLKFPDYVTMAQDGGKVVSLTHRPLLPPFLLVRSAIGRIMSMKHSHDTIWNRTSDLPICSTAP